MHDFSASKGGAPSPSVGWFGVYIDRLHRDIAVLLQ